MRDFSARTYGDDFSSGEVERLIRESVVVFRWFLNFLDVAVGVCDSYSLFFEVGNNDSRSKVIGSFDRNRRRGGRLGHRVGKSGKSEQARGEELEIF